ncbi:integration host factor subunit beta [Maribellus comscasis]|uniref:Integration host factor subunit beta n=1 Tax=Maribellus comscasis TaxID=2681766 RepID=A0A6I6K2J5_9BACT|nr:HU family DNA-binding protein [Maribellus comscasis]QGY47620.1 integration host factor subunit beta [Maribellus comscasis]
MTKADIVNKISKETDIEKIKVTKTIETFMDLVQSTLKNGENVYLRGFGTFEIKKRAEKKARNISKNTTVIVPAHYIPFFRPSKTFLDKVKNNTSNK